MKLMARNRALAIVLAMMMVLMLALPLTAYATPESTGTQVHVKKTDFEISSIKLVYSVGAPLYFELVPGDTSGKNFTTSDSKEDVEEGLLKMEVVFNGPYGSFKQIYQYPADFGDQGGDTEPVEWSAQGSGGAGSINIWINEVDYPEPELSIEKKVKLNGADSGYVDNLTVTSSSVTVEYQFEVTNTGNVELDSYVYDQTLPWVSDTVTIPAGDSHIFKHVFNINGEYWSDHKFVNIASAGAIYNDIYDISSDTDDATVVFDEDFTPDPGLSIEKKVRIADSGAPFSDELEVGVSSVDVEYQFTVSNNGNVDLQDVYFYDPLLGFTSTPAALAVGASYQFVYGPYNISGDAWGESNRVVNIVSAAGIYNGEPVESGTADAVVDYDEDFIANPQLGIEKKVRIAETNAPFSDELEVDVSSVDVEYQFTVSNNGNVDLQDVYFYDPLLGFTSTPAALAVGASYQFVYGPYNISGDAWGESNRVVNIVSAAGIYNGEPVESGTADAVVDYDEPSNPGEPDIDLVKDVSPSTVSSRTTTVTYTFTVHNEGEIDLYNVEITDAAIGYYYEIGYLEAGETTSTSIDFDLENLGTDGYGTWDDDEFTNVAYVYGWYEQYFPQYSYLSEEEDYITRPMVMDDDDATVTYSTSPNPGPRPRPNPTPTPIEEEPTPAGPVVEETPIIEEAIPAAPLPQTGGIPSLLLYGMGALLAGGGAALKLRSRNGK